MNLLLVSLLALLARVSSQCISQNDNLVPPPRTDLDQVTPFSIRLFKEVLPTSGNFFFSPFSIWTALVLAYFGSNGATKTQLEQALRLNNRQETLALFRSVDQLYSQSINPNYTISSANRIYVQQDFPLKDCLQSVFSNEMKSIDFRQAQEAAFAINKFVSDTTREKIQQLVSAGAISDAVMVLVNAVYFKGLWDNQFRPTSTRQEKFYSSPNEPTLVPMMNQKNNFKYGVSTELDAQVLEMPYGGGGASMFVFLPHSKGTGKEIDDLVQRLSETNFRRAISSLHVDEVLLKFPKFKFENQIDASLLQALKRMGIDDLFSSSADLTNFSPSTNLQATDIIHKAVIEVDEEGAEAAAATAVIIAITSVIIPVEPIRFTCDRPFLFFIVDNDINNVLFTGVYRQP